MHVGTVDYFWKILYSGIPEDGIPLCWCDFVELFQIAEFHGIL
jgi:hypothetical protein